MKNNNPGFPLKGIFTFFDLHKNRIIPLLMVAFIGSVLLNVPLNRALKQYPVESSVNTMVYEATNNIITAASPLSFKQYVTAFALFVKKHQDAFLYAFFILLVLYSFGSILIFSFTTVFSSLLYYHKGLTEFSFTGFLRLVGLGSLFTLIAGTISFGVTFGIIFIGKLLLPFSTLFLFFVSGFIAICLVLPILLYGTFTLFICYERHASLWEGFNYSRNLMKGNIIKFIIHRTFAVILLGNLPVFILNTLGTLTWGYSYVASIIVPMIVTTFCSYSFYKQLESPATTNHLS